MKNIIGELGYLKVRRCTMVIDATDWKRGNNGEFIFYEARIVEIYYTSHPEVAGAESVGLNAVRFESYEKNYREIMRIISEK